MATAKTKPAAPKPAAKKPTAVKKPAAPAKPKAPTASIKAPEVKKPAAKAPVKKAAVKSVAKPVAKKPAPPKQVVTGVILRDPKNEVEIILHELKPVPDSEVPPALWVNPLEGKRVAFKVEIVKKGGARRRLTAEQLGLSIITLGVEILKKAKVLKAGEKLDAIFLNNGRTKGATVTVKTALSA